MNILDLLADIAAIPGGLEKLARTVEELSANTVEGAIARLHRDGLITAEQARQLRERHAGAPAPSPRGPSA